MKRERQQAVEIGAAIKRHLDAIGPAPADFPTTPGLSLGMLYRALKGDFTEKTLKLIETALGKSFTPQKAEAGSVPPAGMEELVGSYLCLRPVFRTPSEISAYCMDFVWNGAAKCLDFKETQRFDASYKKVGVVHLPLTERFMNLASNESSKIRLIILSMPDRDGIACGVIAGVHEDAEDRRQTPVVAPFVIRKIAPGAAAPTYGRITPADPAYAEYRTLLNGVVSKGYALMISEVGSAPKPLKVVGSR